MQAQNTARYGLDPYGEPRSIWNVRAERLIEQALARVQTVDVSADLSAAMKCLEIESGDAEADELDGYPFPGEEPDVRGCICTPEQRETGGFTSRCPVHG